MDIPLQTKNPRIIAWGSNDPRNFATTGSLYRWAASAGTRNKPSDPSGGRVPWSKFSWVPVVASID